MKNEAFTLSEVLIVVAVLMIVTAAVYDGYVLSQKAYRESETSAEITQNGRVILERITREIRQAKEIIGDFPEDRGSAENEITFEDGHISEPYNYIHYFKTDNTVKREVIVYYFFGDPEETPVPWNAIPPLGQTLLTKNLEEARVIGEYVDKLEFWGERVINVSLGLQEKDKSLNLETKILGRNL